MTSHAGKTPQRLTPLNGEERVAIGGGDVMVFDSTASTYQVSGHHPVQNTKKKKESPAHADEHEVSVSSSVAPSTFIHPTEASHDLPPVSMSLPPDTVVHTETAATEAPTTATADQPVPEEYEYELVYEEEEEPGNYSIVVRCAAELIATILFVFVGVLQSETWYQTEKYPTNVTQFTTSENFNWTTALPDNITTDYEETLTFNTTVVSLLNATEPNATDTQMENILGLSDKVLNSAFAHGLALFALVSSFAKISGGHVNPAVTLGMLIAGKVDLVSAGAYVISQLVGSLAGAGLTRAVISTNTLETAGATLVGEDYQWFHSLAAEIIATFLLVLVVLMAASEVDHPLSSAVIGLSVTVGILSLGQISGGSLNPARSFGPQAVGAMILESSDLPSRYWIDHWIYYIGPFSGAAMAAGLFRLLLSKERIICP